MKKGLTGIGLVVDKSGSMLSLKDDTIGSYNSLIQEQRNEAGDAITFLTEFNSNVEVGELTNINNCKLLDGNNFRPDGGTALYDAIGAAIDYMGKEIANMAEEERPEKIIFDIFTDGNNNASKKHTKDSIQKKIKHQTDVYNWKFIFSGANIDAYTEGSSIGVNPKFTNQYEATSFGTRSLYSTVSSQISELRCNP